MQTGLSGALRLTASLSLVLLATLAILVVLDILPGALFQAWGVKVVLVMAVVAVTVLVVSVLSRKGPRD